MQVNPFWDISETAANDRSVVDTPHRQRVDRRADRRYPINAKVEYRIANRRKVIETGYGRTIDISTTGVLFESRIPIPRGLKIVLIITWPASSPGASRLELHAEGRTVRTVYDCTAVQIQRCTFRRQQPAAESTTTSPH